LEKEMIFFLFVVGAGAALYQQSFDAAVVANGSQNTLLSDGALISGSAVVRDGTLVLTSMQHEDGGFHAPALNGSSLGWIVTYSLRLSGGKANPGTGQWCLWGDVFGVVTDHVFSNIRTNSSFLGWMVDTFPDGGVNGSLTGFFVVNSTAARTPPASLLTRTLSANQTVDAIAVIAWNPALGATFRTTGFSNDVTLTDVPIVHVGNDSHTWSIAAETGGFYEFAAIDNVIIDAPCGDCQAGGGECVWGSGGRFECQLPPAVQFLQVKQTSGHLFSSTAIGVDFTVYAAIDVFSIGLLDADARGINGMLSASIFDRSTDRVVAGPVTVARGQARADDANPFVFNAVPTVRLQPGVYSIVSVGFTSDRFVSNANKSDSVAAGANFNGAVFITASVSGGNGSLSSTANATGTALLCGATFRFAAAPSPPAAPLPTTEYADCEAVACAGMATGEHNIRGIVRFCDNDMAGGGWLRLWRASETRCEANGWTAARNPRASGTDPAGCRLVAPSCSATVDSQAPFAFREVRGGNWRVWAFGSPGGFDAVVPGDGVVVRDGNGSLVWVLAVGLIEAALTSRLCPCEGAFRNSTASVANLDSAGAHWTCDRAPMRDAMWTPLFDGRSLLTCSGGSGEAAPHWFQRSLAAPQRALSVAICKDTGIDDDLKLASGDLFVRSTVGFHKAQSCQTSVSSTTASSTNGSTASVTHTATVLVTTSQLASEETAVSAAAESTDVALIAGVVVALIGVAVAVGMRHRRKRAPSEMAIATVTSASNYGVAPPAKDEPPRRTSEYGPIVTGSEFDSARVESPYAASVADIAFKSAASQYGALTSAESGTPE
jgi:hypothetical protein